VTDSGAVPHPFVCYAGIALSFLVAWALYQTKILDPHAHFYAPIGLLIAFYTIHAMATDKQVYLKRRFRQVIPKALCKYVFLGLVLWGVQAFYAAHPLYREATVNTRRFFADFCRLFIVLGFPYFILAEKYRYSVDNAMGDPYLRAVSLLRALWKRRFALVRRRLLQRPYKRIYLTAIIRIHYVPIMVEQVYLGIARLSGNIPGFEMHWSLSSILACLTALAWLIDSNNAAVGYFWESWFTKTRMREVDPYPLHWLVVLMCYVPFIVFAVQFIPFPSLPDNSAPLLHDPGWNRAIDIALIVFLTLYMLSGSALSFSTSNLSYKKIQTKGLYGIVRHPATAFKLAFFGLSFFRFRAAFTVTGALCYAAWTTVYILRVLAEEQFLRRFPDYRQYMKNTRYRLIPKVF
jgi:protein-S-isoprenylcysteine O-methyltransferase Ste14